MDPVAGFCCHSICSRLGCSTWLLNVSVQFRVQLQEFSAQGCETHEDFSLVGTFLVQTLGEPADFKPVECPTYFRLFRFQRIAKIGTGAVTMLLELLEDCTIEWVVQRLPEFRILQCGQDAFFNTAGDDAERCQKTTSELVCAVLNGGRQSINYGRLRCRQRGF
jgi:hypothetical protein